MKFVIIGDSHLKRINNNQIEGDATVIAGGGLQAAGITEQFLSKYKKYDVCFLFVGGNDVSYHPTYNPLPKTAKQTANRLISCQIFIDIIFRSHT